MPESRENLVPPCVWRRVWYNIASAMSDPADTTTRRSSLYAPFYAWRFS
jgi:hypothetical protein